MKLPLTGRYQQRHVYVISRFLPEIHAEIKRNANFEEAVRKENFLIVNHSFTATDSGLICKMFLGIPARVKLKRAFFKVTFQAVCRVAVYLKRSDLPVAIQCR